MHRHVPYHTRAGVGDIESICTIHRALDLGITLIDTAETYGLYTNEELVGRRDEVVMAGQISHRGGTRHKRELGGSRENIEDIRTLDSYPGNIRTAPEGCLKRLGTDHIDLYHQHRIDPATQIEDTVGALSDLVRGGKVGYIGLSEAAPETTRRAHGYTRSLLCNPSTRLWTRDPEAEILPLVRALGIGFVAYSPLGRTFLTGQIRSMDQLDADDFRRNNPRYVDANFQQYMRIVEEVEAVAREAGATHAQVALAWLLAQGDHTAPIPGTRRVSRLEENAAADEIELTTDQLACLSAVPPPVCDRYTDMAAKRQMCLTSAALGAKLRRSLEIRR